MTVPGDRLTLGGVYAEPLRPPAADRRQHRGVLRQPDHGDVRQVRRRLVLASPPARAIRGADGLGDTVSICDKLRSVSARCLGDGFGDRCGDLNSRIRKKIR